MKIVVCIKEVPDTDKVKIDPVTKTLIREGIPVIINPDDMTALEFAFIIRERLEGKEEVEISILSMGPPRAEVSLKKLLLYKIDRAILLSDKKFAGSDTFATSYILSRAIKKLEPNIILCGKQAIDGDTAQVGPGIAEHLGIPQITYAEELIDIDNSNITIRRELDIFSENALISLPALITVNSNAFLPRYPSVKRFLKRTEFSIEKWTADDIEGDENFYGLDGSPTKVVNIFTPPQAQSGKIFTDLEIGIAEISNFLKEVKKM